MYTWIFLFLLKHFQPIFSTGGLTLWLIVCSLNKLKMINNFKGHPVLDGPLSLVMFFWPSSRSMHGAKNRILGNHRIFHERGQSLIPSMSNKHYFSLLGTVSGPISYRNGKFWTKNGPKSKKKPKTLITLIWIAEFYCSATNHLELGIWVGW